jgi:pimeloyl-ACP methyl ester carboxylesterase
VNRLTALVHGRAELALHQLRAGGPDGGPATTRPLLLLHGLGESSPARLPAHLASWSGPILALDFTGHGSSSRPLGGGYTAEILLGDVDAALAETGPATLLGRGLGAYVALLAAGARPALVRGAILTDGPGLVGGGVRPSSPFVLTPPVDGYVGPDPFALFEMSHDVRPPDYVVDYVRMALVGSDLDRPVAVCSVVRPEWLVAAIDEAPDRVVELTLDAALDLYA